MNERNIYGNDHGFKIADGCLKKTKQNYWKWLDGQEKIWKRLFIIYGPNL